MKNTFKISAAAALAISALTPVAAFAAETPVDPGFYTTSKHLSGAEFRALPQEAKKALLLNPETVMVVGSKVYTGQEIFSATSNEQIKTMGVTVAAFEANNGAFSGNGYGQAVAGELKVESVKAINAFQVEVTFNQPVDMTTGAHGALNADNFYFGLKDSVDGQKLSALATGGEYTLVEGSDFNETTETGTKVIIQATSGADTFFDSSVLKVKKGEVVSLEVRNIETAGGKGTDNQTIDFKIEDHVKPTVKAAKDKIDYVAGNAATVDFKFSEPILNADPTDLTDTGITTGAQVYLNGNEITSGITIVDPEGDFDEASTLNIAGLTLEEGVHEFTFVGVKDLAGNFQNPNPTTVTVTVLEKVAEQVIPVVEGVEQVDDNAVVFYTNVAVNPALGEITVEKIDGTTDLTIDLASPTAGVTFAADTNLTNAAKGIYAYKLTLPATNDVTAGSLSYNKANQIIRTFVVKDLVNAADATAVQKTTFKKTETLVKDITAPTVSSDVKIVGEDFVIKFNDKPFNKAVTVGTAKDITIKYVKDGLTYEETITATSAMLGTDGVTLTIPTTTLTDILDANSKLVKGATYSIVLPNGLVNDGATNTSNNLDPARPHNFVGKTLTVKVPGSSTGYEVPQISQADVTHPTTKENRFSIKVHGKDVDSATVLNKANYTWNGAALPADTEIEFVSAGASATFDGTIYITLPKGSVQFAGNYELDVKNIATKTTGYKMLPTTVTVTAFDNAGPALQSAIINSSNEILLTFSESLTTGLSSAELQQAVNNIAVTVGTTPQSVLSVVEVAGNDKQLKVTTATNFDVDSKVTVSIKLDHNGNIVITDAKGNYATESKAPVTAAKKQ